MPRLLQHLLAPLDPIVHGADPRAVPAAADEELALGCECAHPPLQVEGWEPQAAAPAATPGY